MIKGLQLDLDFSYVAKYLLQLMAKNLRRKTIKENEDSNRNLVRLQASMPNPVSTYSVCVYSADKLRNMKC